ncbi:MAG TPA: hypothetical protein VK091_06280 [Virgibacillus sp.]|nr:hypothetical protein [Virgibacillus sp.]
MFEIKVTKQGESIAIKWLLGKIKIPVSEIIDVTYDESYAGESKTAVRIGYPYGTTDRILIKTVKTNYIIYTSIGSIKEKILSLINRSKGNI